MTDLIQQFADQPRFAQDILLKMFEAIRRRRDFMSINARDMTNDIKVWLRTNGIDYRFNPRLNEWEISLEPSEPVDYRTIEREILTSK